MNIHCISVDSFYNGIFNILNNIQVEMDKTHFQIFIYLEDQNSLITKVMLFEYVSEISYAKIFILCRKIYLFKWYSLIEM